MYNYAPHIVQCLCPWSYAKANDGMHIVPTLCNVVQTEGQESMDTCKGEQSQLSQEGMSASFCTFCLPVARDSAVHGAKLSRAPAYPSYEKKTTNQKMRAVAMFSAQR